MHLLVLHLKEWTQSTLCVWTVKPEVKVLRSLRVAKVWLISEEVGILSEFFLQIWSDKVNICGFTRKNFFVHLGTGLSSLIMLELECYVYSSPLIGMINSLLPALYTFNKMHCFTGAAQSEAIEIYEWVNLAVTLCSETQQVVMLLCPPQQRQVLPTTRDKSLLTLDNEGKQGNKKV